MIQLTLLRIDSWTRFIRPNVWLKIILRIVCVCKVSNIEGIRLKQNNWHKVYEFMVCNLVRSDYCSVLAINNHILQTLHFPEAIWKLSNALRVYCCIVARAMCHTQEIVNVRNYYLRQLTSYSEQFYAIHNNNNYRYSKNLYF